MASSLHPLSKYLPFLGKLRERQIILGKVIFKVGSNEFFFQIMMSPPEHVPKISLKSFKNAIELILELWQM
jgi:hypothetical protein